MFAQAKFKEGQIVRVLSVKEGDYEFAYFTKHMVEMIGKVFTIVSVNLYNYHVLYVLVADNGESWNFQEDWLEAV